MKNQRGQGLQHEAKNIWQSLKEYSFRTQFLYTKYELKIIGLHIWPLRGIQNFFNILR